MKRIIYLLTFIITLTLVGCDKVDNSKVVSNFDKKIEVVYSKGDIKKVKKLLKSYGTSHDLTIKKVKNREILVIKDGIIKENENLWNEFFTNTKNNKESYIIILQYTPQNDPILTYLSYKNNEYYMLEDDSRDKFREGEKEDYYEYTFKYLKLFEENEKVYVYLLDDDKITLEKLNYSLLGSKIDEWIPYGFVFYYNK